MCCYMPLLSSFILVIINVLDFPFAEGGGGGIWWLQVEQIWKS